MLSKYVGACADIFVSKAADLATFQVEQATLYERYSFSYHVYSYTFSEKQEVKGLHMNLFKMSILKIMF